MNLLYTHIHPLFFRIFSHIGHCCCLVTAVSNSLWTHGLQHARLPCHPLSPGVCSNSCPFIPWCYLTISSSTTPFSFYLQSSPVSLFQWVNSLHQVAKVLQLQLQHQSFQWIFRVDFLYDWLVSSRSPRDSKESSSAPQFKNINSLALSLTFIHDYWKNHSFD